MATMERYSLNSILDVIRDMESNEQIHTDCYLGDVVLEITKYPNYSDLKDVIIMDRIGADEFNLVTVDFLINGKSIASTDNIHVDELENVLNDIRDGDTSHLIDEDKPLADIVKAAEKSRNKGDRDDR